MGTQVKVFGRMGQSPISQMSTLGPMEIGSNVRDGMGDLTERVSTIGKTGERRRRFGVMVNE